MELSAEDVAQIRAEHQKVKARERESNKYTARSPGSFKGFQDFLNSLYRAIALQVTTSEEQDDSWSALNRRYGGTRMSLGPLLIDVTVGRVSCNQVKKYKNFQIKKFL